MFRMEQWRATVWLVFWSQSRRARAFGTYIQYLLAVMAAVSQLMLIGCTDSYIMLYIYICLREFEAIVSSILSRNEYTMKADHR